MNQYRYCQNPINEIDPLGLKNLPGGQLQGAPQQANNGLPSVNDGAPPKPPMTPEQRRADMDRRIEENAERRVREYEAKYNMHTVGKHSPDVADADLKQRAIDGTDPVTGKLPKGGPKGNPSSQFVSWRVQLHAINEAMTRKARGLPQHTGTDIRKNPVVRGELDNSGRGYKPNSNDKNNPSYIDKMDGFEVKFDRNNPDNPFTAYPTENK
ncbi:hypothetical protein SOASR029_30320 [Budvicia aquatica]|nr:hypothetical protein SOASR029_30320 [Budvicia aquatica]